MAWDVEFHIQFVPEFEALADAVQDEILAHVAVLETFGPQRGRPRVDTLYGSRHANMKELRFDVADGVWRFAFAFDPKRRAIVLCGGSKSGSSQRRFYRQLIDTADKRFNVHLAAVKQAAAGQSSSKSRKR